MRSGAVLRLFEGDARWPVQDLRFDLLAAMRGPSAATAASSLYPGGVRSSSSVPSKRGESEREGRGRVVPFADLEHPHVL
jgi:hypothetical protein